MRPEHKNVFFDVADAHTCWLGLREPNELSDRWVGRPGGAAKPESCKAKSSDNPSFRWAGLVVNPLLCPEAFLHESLSVARKKWEQFARSGPGGRGLPSGYTCAEQGSERGLVKLHGRFLYADFDLMAVVRSGPDGEFLFTTPRQQAELFDKVRVDLNRRLGVEMIQHGAEMMWTGGVGARESEWIYWFGPGRRFRQDRSSMPGPYERGGGH